MNNITMEELKKFEKWYFGSGVNKTIRYGQAFIGYFLPGVVDPELFYENDIKKAQEIVLNKYVDINQGE